MIRILYKADIHLEAGEDLKKPYLLVKEFAKWFKPDLTIDGGDLFEFEYISSFSKEKLKKLEGKRFRLDYDLGNREMDFWQKYSKEYVQIEGNHERRIVWLLDKDPRFEGLVELPENLRFKERGIKFYPMDGKVFKVGKLAFVHGYWANKYAARRHLERYKSNIVFGHTHKFSTASDALPLMETEIQAWGIGCLGDKEPDWKNGEPTGWQNGFAVIYVDEKNGRFNVYPINITKYNEFIWEGKIWKL